MTEGSNNLTSGESPNNVSSLKNCTSWNMHTKRDRLQSSLDLGPELQDWGSTHESSVAESFPLPLPDGDSFWECKSPVQSSQVWCYSLSFSPLSHFTRVCLMSLNSMCLFKAILLFVCFFSSSPYDFRHALL